MSRTTFGFQFGQPQPQPAREVSSSGPLRLVIVGDFSGRASRGAHEPESIRSRRLHRLDVDNFDSVLGQLTPTLHIPLSARGEGVAITVRSLDDFHPDALFDQLDLFAELRASRRRLLNPATFAAEAARLRPASSGSPDQGVPATSPTPSEPPAKREGGKASPATPSPGAGALLDQVLAETGETSGEAALAAGGPAASIRIAGIDLGRLVEEVVAPYVLPKPDARQAELVEAVDAAAGEFLRRLLHAPAFQELEAAWRQLWRLTKAVTGDSSVALYLLDVTAAEMGEDIAQAGDAPTRAGLFRLLIDQNLDPTRNERWGAIVVLKRFGHSEADCQLLGGLGSIAEAGRGVLLADADPALIGLQSWEGADDFAAWPLGDRATEERWDALRKTTAAARIALAAPRLLVRLPYGRINATERLAFEELSVPRRHNDLAWGFAALGIAELLGTAAVRSQPTTSLQDLDDLPPYVYEEDGDKQLQPAAEVFLTIPAAEALAQRGILPLLSYKDRHAARVMRYTSLSGPLRLAD